MQKHLFMEGQQNLLFLVVAHLELEELLSAQKGNLEGQTHLLKLQ